VEHVYVSDLGFRRDVDEICALLGYYTASSGNPVVKVQDYHSTLRNIPEERRSHVYVNLKSKKI
jgi:hypothetical protein